jgi:hypothetical protein
VKLFYNLDTGELLDVNRQLITRWTLRYKDELPLVIAFLRAGEVVEPAGVTIVPTVKLAGEFDADPICPSVTFGQTGTGVTALWTGTLLVDSATIEEELKDNAEESDDVVFFTASIQFYFEADGGISRSAVTPCDITNSLYRGDEDFPVVVGSEGLYALSSTTPTWKSTIVTFTGGGATALDGQTAVIDGSTIFTLGRLLFLNIDGSGLKAVVLKAGTQATDGVSFVRPANYAAGTFAYVFNIIL